MLKNNVISDRVIVTFENQPEITRIRCTKNRELQFRYSKNRSNGNWYLYCHSKWHKVGEWPTVKTRDIRLSLPTLLLTLRAKGKAIATSENFKNVGNLLKWYGDRTRDNANLSDQRLRDIKSALKCHLLPKIASLPIAEVNHNALDKALVWPSQKQLSKATVSKHFAILKAAFKDAYDLKLIAHNELAGFKISDFGEFHTPPKAGRIKPKQVKAILRGAIEQPAKLYMITTLMLTLGTRLGETRQARWSQLHLDDTPEWNIPAENTKTGKPLDIKLPSKLAKLLQQWKQHQSSKHNKGDYLFPNKRTTKEISASEVSGLFRCFSGGLWSSHDLRKVARVCWSEQGVDFAIGERMLNHSLGAVAETYLDSGGVSDQKLQALEKHTTWIDEQHPNYFDLSEVTQRK